MSHEKAQAGRVEGQGKSIQEENEQHVLIHATLIISFIFLAPSHRFLWQFIWEPDPQLLCNPTCVKPVWQDSPHIS